MAVCASQRDQNALAKSLCGVLGAKDRGFALYSLGLDVVAGYADCAGALLAAVDRTDDPFSRAFEFGALELCALVDHGQIQSTPMSQSMEIRARRAT